MYCLLVHLTANCSRLCVPVITIQFNCLSMPVHLSSDNSQTKAKEEWSSTQYFSVSFFFYRSANAAACLSTLRSVGAQVEAVRADVLLASSLPGLVSTVTFHLKEGIYSVQSVGYGVCLCVSVWGYTNSHQCVCVCVQVHAMTIQSEFQFTLTQ